MTQLERQLGEKKVARDAFDVEAVKREYKMLREKAATARAAYDAADEHRVRLAETMKDAKKVTSFFSWDRPFFF